ncbi:alpha-amylase family glycosyl hydrolase [Anaerosporobacter faecicola]|uniref:alpha-amylase family glycosyl hydrolase n=1 Tax=Anaerosporobacter faecicola TaxID=2718714 RepID=UPI00143B9201|nr:alpha-amylase family glycosyl hydrolase [Anaerosporobacter faecicola]
MKQKATCRRVISILMVLVMVVTLLPDQFRMVKAEAETVRRLDDKVELVVGGQPYTMNLYSDGVYEIAVPAASGAAIEVNVNGTKAGSSTWETAGTNDVYVTYNSVTKEIQNSISNSGAFKQSATWVGKLSDLTGADLADWTPGDEKADLDYMGGGIFQKTFGFSELESDFVLQHDGYKVAYNHDWGNGEVSDGDKVALTIPSGSNQITVYANSRTGYITDSVNTPTIEKEVSLIGSIRNDEAVNWEIAQAGWEFTNIDGSYAVYNQVFDAGTYDYKVVFNKNEWAEGGNNTIILPDTTNVVFVYDYSTNMVYDSVNDYNTVASFLGFPGNGEEELVPDKIVAQPGGQSVWRVTGNCAQFDNWNTTGANSVMSHLVGEYYAKSVVLNAGSYEFKFTKNGTWDGAIGGTEDNFKLTLTEKTKVNFYINDELEGNDRARINIDSLESQGLKQYIPQRTQETWPRLVGNIQTLLGDEADWNPASAKNFLVDYYFNDTEYRIQRTIAPERFPAEYSIKVVYGNSWDSVDYGDGTDNHVLKVLDAANVTFTTTVPTEFADGKGVLKDDYKPQNSAYDGKIDTAELYYDSQSTTYKSPFGAIPMEGENVTFRLAAKAGDAQLVKLELANSNDIAKTYPMSIVTVLDDKDYWEVTVPAKDFDSIGVWSYKFIVVDGTAKVEYGDDGVSGGTGAYAEEGQTGYDLTVYEKDFKTPDWMKNAVVYQIFPDRFYDGDSSNNNAKLVDGSRGDGVQLFDGSEGAAGNWSDYPENPRQSEEANKPYYPDATTDGVWSNEFYGGDISGIRTKLSYLQHLGVTAIYLNPVSWAASNHKYDATDYKHLDPMFGEPIYNVAGDPTSGLNYEETKKASDLVYKAFADVCNELGIYLIADGVFNHVGDDSIYFDRYEKYPEIGAYEYWSKVWNTVETQKVTQAEAEKQVKANYKAQINPNTNTYYTEEDFVYTTWFEVGPDKVYDKNGNFERYEYECWWGYDSLPCVKSVTAEETNLTNDENATIAGSHEYNNVEYRNEVIGYELTGKSDAAAQEAMQEANSQRWLWMGANGWRLDVAPDVSDATWQQFRKAVKSAAGYTDANGNTIADPIILGEEWGVATKYLLGDMFDSVMNYQFRSALQNFIINGADAKTFDAQLETIRENYPEEAWYAMLNLVDSHDTVRNITKIDNPSWEEENTANAKEASERAIQLQALTAIFQLSYPGAPTIYYGDEVGVTGTKDPDSRRTFPWERINASTNEIATAYADQYGTLYNTYVNAANVRNANKELFATGDIKTAYAEGNVIAYARKSDTKGGLAAINTSDQAVTFEADVTDFLPEGLVLKDQLGSSVQSVVNGGKVNITIPAYSGIMMVSTQGFDELPVAPTTVTAVETNGAKGKVTVSWDAVEGADSYGVYRAYLDGADKEFLATVTETTYEDTSVTNGTRYYYYIKTNKDGLSSNYSTYASALPSYEITSLGKPSDAQDVTLGMGNTTEEITATIAIPGLTDDEQYTNKDVPNLSLMLFYYTGEKESAESVKLRYKEDVLTDGKVTAKTYSTSFEPTRVGEYRYFAKATVNNGYTFTSSEENVLTVIASANTDKPVKPELQQALSESNRATLNWTCEDSSVKGFDIFRSQATKNGEGAVTFSEFQRIDTVDAATNGYVDYAVNNDTTYKYYVEAFNEYYNRTKSEIIEVTPKLVMVEVTMRLTIPTKVYTSATDSIYIASDANGWTPDGWELKKPSGATDGNIVEYTFKMMAGKKIQYKYTRGSWETEALTSSNPNDTTSAGNYGYSAMDTNIPLTIRNQGGNKMLVEDYVLRWVDMPLMITVPRISYGNEDISYETTEETFDLQASVPMGGIFTINGTDINSIQAGALDAYGNVRLNKIPLEVGVNTFVLHIEPTEDTKKKEWLTDSGRIETQMTATKTITITRKQSGVQEGDKEDDKGEGTNTGSNGSAPSSEPRIVGQSSTSGWEAINESLVRMVKDLDKEQIEEKVVEVIMNEATKVPYKIFTTIAGTSIKLVLITKDYQWTIEGERIDTGILSELSKSDEAIDLGFVNLDKDTKKQEIDTILEHTLAKNKDTRKVTGITYFELAHEGKFPFEAQLTFTVGKEYAGKTIFLNYVNEKEDQVEPQCYVRVKDNGQATVRFEHASKYVVTLENTVLPTLLTKKTLYTGSTYKIGTKVKNSLPGDAATYYTSKKSVVSVSKSGKLTAKKAGTATITTRYVQNGKVYVFLTKVTVKKPYIKLTKVPTKLKVKESFTCKAKVYGAKDSLVWSVSDTKVASINKKTGKIKAKKAGKVVVTVKAGDITKKFTITITK